MFDISLLQGLDQNLLPGHAGLVPIDQKAGQQEEDTCRQQQRRWRKGTVIAGWTHSCLEYWMNRFSPR